MGPTDRGLHWIEPFPVTGVGKCWVRSSFVLRYLRKSAWSYERRRRLDRLDGSRNWRLCSWYLNQKIIDVGGREDVLTKKSNCNLVHNVSVKLYRSHRLNKMSKCISMYFYRRRSGKLQQYANASIRPLTGNANNPSTRHYVSGNIFMGVSYYVPALL